MRKCQAILALVLGGVSFAYGQGTNVLSGPLPLPEVGFSALRVLGSLILVLALFLGGVWIYRNWQRVAVYRGRAPQLNILEVKSLGNRHALYLVAYQQQRLLIASSPAGVNLLSHLPEADGDEVRAPVPTLAQSFRQVLASKT
jgi:flagellar biogenesis protein FliO